MAITIDASLGGANANSYVTLAEAETYIEARLYSDAWTNLTDEEIKKQALLGATKRIDYEKFSGYIVANTQKLSFPRNGLALLDGRDINGIIPSMVKEAQIELAIYMLSQDMSKPSVDTSNLKEYAVKVGAIEETKKYAIDANDNVSTANSEMPPNVEYLLQDLSYTMSTGGIAQVGR